MPLGEPVETLEFWPGKRLISTDQNVHLHQQMLTLDSLKGLLWNVELGLVKVRDVPLSISQNVRTALEGLSILGGAETLTEKK